MRPRRRRYSRLLLRCAVGLTAAGVLSSCQGNYATELVVEECRDQDGNRLPPGVMVNVDGFSAIWNDEPLRFPIEVKDGVKLVRIKAGTSALYTYNSKAQYAIPPGKTTTITLHFFKPYTVVVRAHDRREKALRGADVHANGRRIGTTGEDGRFVWRIDHPLTPAGSMRPGARFQIQLECNGQSAEVEPVVFRKNRYTYTVEVPFDARSASGACATARGASG